MEVESVSHWGQTILLSARSTSTKASTVTTQLSLVLQQIPFAFTHVTEHPTPNRREDINFDVKN